jgi:PKD repeat protein
MLGLRHELSTEATGSANKTPIGISWEGVMKIRKSAIKIALGFLLATVPLCVFGQTGAWTGDGPEGTFTVVSDGTISCPELEYFMEGQAVWDLQTWDFHTTATSSGTIELPYHYSGLHAWHQVEVFLDAYVIHGGETNTTPVFSMGPVNCCEYPSNGFNEVGTVTLTVESGDTYGFRFGGENYDSSDVLMGTFVIGLPREPVANFSWAPETPEPGETVEFVDNSLNTPTSWEWDVGADGLTDSTEHPFSYAFAEPGLYPVRLRVGNPYGFDEVTKNVTVVPAPGGPTIIGVVRDYPGVFLEGIDVVNTFEAFLDWPEDTTGTVTFTVDDNAAPKCTVTGAPSVAPCGFDMASDFTPQWTAHTVTVEACSEGGICHVSNQSVFVFPYPDWLVLAGGSDLVEITVGNGEVTASLGAEFPTPHLAWDCTLECIEDPTCRDTEDNGCKKIPDSVPLLEGEFGLLDTFAGFDGSVSSLGTGSLSLFGQTGFYAMESSVMGSIRGDGEFRFESPLGLEITHASFNLHLDGLLAKEVQVSDIPQVQPLTELWLIGPYIEDILERATLRAEIGPSLDLTASWAQNDLGDLEFESAEGTLGLDLRVVASLDLGALTIRAWAAGGGSFTLGLPDDPLVRAAAIRAQLGIEASLDYTIKIWIFKKTGTVSAGAILDLGCEYTYYEPWSCYANADLDFDVTKLATGLFPEAGPVTVMTHDYGRFGRYAEFRADPVAHIKSSSVPVAINETVLVANLFPGASPAIAVTNQGRLLVWEHEDLEDPELRNTEISWSYDDGSGWSEPGLIADDIRAEFSPVLVPTADGTIVAAWLRNKDESLTAEDLEDTTDLPLFYKQHEVVSAVFDPSQGDSGEWGDISQLTDDESMDTNLRLSSDGGGNIMLTWLSNPDGAFHPTTDELPPLSPSSLMYSLWNGTGFGTPGQVAGGLYGVSSHAAAISGGQAAILTTRDPDPTVSGDEIIELYEWDSSQWSEAKTFAASQESNRAPSVVFDDEGRGHVVWVRNHLVDGEVQADLFKAAFDLPLEEPPAVYPIRSGSASLAFQGARLLNSPGGNLTLLWQEVVDNQPADIFAMIFDSSSETWSKDRRLLARPELVHQASAVYDQENVLHAVYLTTVIEREDQEVEIDGRIWTLPNVPVEGQTDLVEMKHILGLDLAVDDDDLVVDPPLPQEDDSVTATVSIHNGGDGAIGAFDVQLWIGEPGLNGVLIEQRRLFETEWFLAGATHACQFTFTHDGTAGDLVVVVDSSDEVVPEITEANNRATWYLENTPPTAIVTADPTSGAAPLTVSFDGSSSYDLDKDSLRFSWAFADGSAATTGATVTHSFRSGGRYPVTLSVTDQRGAVGTATVVIDVSGPTAPEDLIAEIVIFYHAGLAGGSIEGLAGNPQVATRRERAISAMLDTAADLIDSGDWADACDQLSEIVALCDGSTPPKDFITGEDVPDLYDMLLELMAALSCS